MKSLNVLVACEFSAVVRDAFRRRGHNAWSCDLEPCEGDPRWHYCGDVFSLLFPEKRRRLYVPTEVEHMLWQTEWHMLIHHWPCTRLCNSGVRWLHERNLWDEMRESAENFRRLTDCGIPKVCGENPIPHKYAKAIMGDYTQIIQPWQFGHAESKATCLWLRNLPPLIPTDVVGGPYDGRVWKESPGPDRWKRRSITYTGIAEAMADQWGNL